MSNNTRGGWWKLLVLYLDNRVWDWYHIYGDDTEDPHGKKPSMKRVKNKIKTDILNSKYQNTY